MVKICKSWEQQVLDNTLKLEKAESDITKDKLDIINLDSKVGENSGDIAEIKEGMINLSGDVAALEGSALKTPLQAPYTDVLVGIGSNNEQELIHLGTNLSIGNGILNATGGGGGGGGWTKGTVDLNDLADTFTLNVTDAEAPIIIGIVASGGYYSATMTNNAQASYPYAYSTLFYAWDTICCIKSEDGTCNIIDAATGQTPPNDGGATIEYWYQ